MTRRTFLRLAAGSMLAGGALAVDAWALEPCWLETTRHAVPVGAGRHGLSGFVVAHVTDLHLRRTQPLHARVLQALERAAPGLVVLTGDMVESARHLGELGAFCARLVSLGCPVVATLGNWEYGEPGLVDAIAAMYARVGVRLLLNGRWSLAGGALVVAGVDDGATGHADPVVALQGWENEGGVRLMLTHAPGILDAFPPGLAPAHLVLCGHTHGGQVRLGPVVPVRPHGSGRFLAGFYETPAGLAYVSRGLGTTLYPVRLMCRPELALFWLR